MGEAQHHSGTAESLGGFQRNASDSLQESEDFTEHVANGPWEVFMESVGSSWGLLAACSYKLFNFKRDH